MPSNQYRSGPATYLKIKEVFKSVNLVTLTGTTAASVWTPTTGLRFVLKRVHLRAIVSTVLLGATVGDPLILFDSTSAAPLGSFAHLGASGTLGANGGVVISATDAVGIDYGFCDEDFGEGYRSAAVNNVLKVGTLATIGTGVIRIFGWVAGTETI